MRSALGSLALGLGLVLLAGGAVGARAANPSANPDPDVLPKIGNVAPAFGLKAFRAKGEEDDLREVVELDNYCGVRPLDGLKLVLVVFADQASATSDFGVLNSWARKFEKDGLHTIVISTEAENSRMKELVSKGRQTWPVLDDRFGVVQRRYGIQGAPFSLLLDERCHVLGMSNKSISADSDRLAATIDDILSGRLGEYDYDAE